MKAKLLIAGNWQDGSGEIFTSENPATQKTVWQGRAANTLDIEKALESAKTGFEIWSETTFEERSKKMHSFHDALKRAKDELKVAISHETGKPYWEAETEVDATVNKVLISIKAHLERASDVIKPGQNQILAIRKRPIGIAAVFGPYNFPAHLPNGHIIPALLAGNAVIFKPSELTPMVGEVIAVCMEEAKLPKGVFQLLQGGKDTGEALSSNKNLDALFFTGSFATGKKLSEKFSLTPGKMIALEMGGNNPIVVSSVKDLKQAALLTIFSAFITSGQRCSAARRLIVIRSDKSDLFLKELVESIARLKIGPCTDIPEPFMGPLITESAAKKVEAGYQDLLHLGGKAVINLKREKAFIYPSIVDVTGVQNLPDDEIFGPLLQLTFVENLDEAIQKANETDYGLSASLLSDTRDEFALFLKKVKAGIVNWNYPTTAASSAAPFGGLGKSGNNRPSAYYAVDYCTSTVSSIEQELMELPQSIPPGII